MLHGSVWTGVGVTHGSVWTGVGVKRGAKFVVTTVLYVCVVEHKCKRFVCVNLCY